MSSHLGTCFPLLLGEDQAGCWLWAPTGSGTSCLDSVVSHPHRGGNQDSGWGHRTELGAPGPLEPGGLQDNGHKTPVNTLKGRGQDLGWLISSTQLGLSCCLLLAMWELLVPGRAVSSPVRRNYSVSCGLLEGLPRDRVCLAPSWGPVVFLMPDPSLVPTVSPRKGSPRQEDGCPAHLLIPFSPTVAAPRPPLPHVEQYEVVRPQRLPGPRARRALPSGVVSLGRTMAWWWCGGSLSGPTVPN